MNNLLDKFVDNEIMASAHKAEISYQYRRESPEYDSHLGPEKYRGGNGNCSEILRVMTPARQLKLFE